MKKYILSMVTLITCCLSLSATHNRQEAERIYHAMKAYEQECMIHAIEDRLEQQERERREYYIKIPFQVSWFVLKNTSKLGWYLTRSTTQFIYHLLAHRDRMNELLLNGDGKEWFGLMGTLGLSTAFGYYLNYKIISSCA